MLKCKHGSAAASNIIPGWAKPYFCAEVIVIEAGLPLVLYLIKCSRHITSIKYCVTKHIHGTYMYIEGQTMFLMFCTCSNFKGILAQETGEKLAKFGESYIAASYVKYIESAGARVVPILYPNVRLYFEKLLLPSSQYVLSLSKLFLDTATALHNQNKSDRQWTWETLSVNQWVSPTNRTLSINQGKYENYLLTRHANVKGLHVLAYLDWDAPLNRIWIIIPVSVQFGVSGVWKRDFLLGPFLDQVPLSAKILIGIQQAIKWGNVF